LGITVLVAAERWDNLLLYHTLNPKYYLIELKIFGSVQLHFPPRIKFVNRQRTSMRVIHRIVFLDATRSLMQNYQTAIIRQAQKCFL